MLADFERRRGADRISAGSSEPEADILIRREAGDDDIKCGIDVAATRCDATIAGLWNVVIRASRGRWRCRWDGRSRRGAAWNTDCGSAYRNGGAGGAYRLFVARVVVVLADVADLHLEAGHAVGHIGNNATLVCLDKHVLHLPCYFCACPVCFGYREAAGVEPRVGEAGVAGLPGG